MGTKKLQPEERDEIARLSSQGFGVREIAKRVGRSASTISVELKAGTWHDNNRHTNTYVAIHAQRLREQRALRSHKQAGFAKPELEAYVRVKLGLG